jgi:hypothetical protein
MTENFQNFLTGFETLALPYIKRGKSFTFYISNAMAKDELVREVCRLKAGSSDHGSFLGVTIEIVSDSGRGRDHGTTAYNIRHSDTVNRELGRAPGTTL